MVLASCGGTPPEASGPNESIQVHGDWTINIYNEDGSLDSHVEFSNDLTNGGSEVLADVLSGASNYGASGGNSPEWEIVLGETGGVDFTGTSPCTDQYPKSPSVPENPALFLTEACYIVASVAVTGGPSFGIELTGSVEADRAGTIDIVETTHDQFFQVSENQFSRKVRVFTRNIEAPLPIDVQAGQTIQVQVDISFTSG